MYYLNAFNEMLRKRQRQNMMGGEGYQGVGNAPPSGPMGLGPAQDRSSLRDFYNNMSPGARFGLSMVPGVGKALNIGNLASYAMSQYDKSQLAPANAAMEAARQGFQASEKGLYDAPEYGAAPPSFVDPSAYEGAMSSNSFPAGSMGGTAPGYVDDSNDRLGFSGPTVGGAAPQRSLAFESLPTMATDTIGLMTSLGSQGGSLQSGGLSSQTGLYGDAAAGMGGGAYGGGADAPGANADSYGGGDAGFGGNSQAFNQGGMVTPDRLMGRAPAPDDGYGALQGGEYVITKAAVEKYGKRLLDAINNGTFR
jgi:hypothetical protein